MSIRVQMGASSNGRDPRVWVDGEDVTARVTGLELLPQGVAVVHLLTDQRVRQLVQGNYEVIQL